MVQQIEVLGELDQMDNIRTHYNSFKGLEQPVHLLLISVGPIQNIYPLFGMDTSMDSFLSELVAVFHFSK